MPKIVKGQVLGPRSSETASRNASKAVSRTRLRQSLKEAERLHAEAAAAYEEAKAKGDTTLVVHWSKLVSQRHELVTRIRGDLTARPQNTYGVSEDQAKRIIEQWKDLSSASEVRVADVCVEYLRIFNRAHPGDARYILRQSRPRRFDAISIEGTTQEG